jgi:hypothetical protein
LFDSLNFIEIMAFLPLARFLLPGYRCCGVPGIRDLWVGGSLMWIRHPAAPLCALQLQTFALTAVTVLALSGSARAIPSHTEHPHNNPGTIDLNTTWIKDPPPGEQVADPDPDTPNATMHQHRDRDALDGNAKYIGFSVWDNRDYRVGGHYGHGFIEPDQAPRYLFDFAFPALGRGDFDNAVEEWESAVNGSEINVNGVPIVISMDYDRVDRGAREIDVFWRDIGAADDFATAFWDPATTDFTFDSDPIIIKRKRVDGPQISLQPGNVGCADSLQLPWQWFFGGTGAVNQVSADYFECTAANAKLTVTGNAYDFYTIALHEIGHSFALDHIGPGIMREDIASFVMRDPDANSIDGLKDHYAIPVPEPETLLLLASGAGVLMTRRRRTRRSGLAGQLAGSRCPVAVSAHRSQLGSRP